MILDSLSDLEILILTIYGEARGEVIEGQIAVGCVIRNRGTDYKKECLAPKQFSCWNVNDPNRVILDELAQKMIDGQVITNHIFDQITWVAKGIINGLIIDNTGGSKNYITKNLWNTNRPDWAKKVTWVNHIGSQVFFNV